MLAVRLALFAALTLTGACVNLFTVPVSTASRPPVEGALFGRVLLVGFVARENRDVDLSVETVRLLKTQIRRGSALAVVEAASPLDELIAARRAKHEHPEEDGQGMPRAPTAMGSAEAIFADAALWQRVGQEYRQPLIITGTLTFASTVRRRLVEGNQEAFDSMGRRSVAPVRSFETQTIFSLEPVFVFIDGRSGHIVHRLALTEDIAYALDVHVPPLAAYFELMDRLIPSVLGVFTQQQVLGPRYLLR